MEQYNTSHEAITLGQAVVTLRGHRTAVLLKAGFGAGLLYPEDQERAVAAACKAQDAASESFSWPTSDEWQQHWGVRLLESWTALYAQLASCTVAVARQRIMEAMNAMLNLQQQALEFTNLICDAEHAGNIEDKAALTGKLEHICSQIADMERSFGYKSKLASWLHDTHNPRCARCTPPKKVAE